MAAVQPISLLVAAAVAVDPMREPSGSVCGGGGGSVDRDADSGVTAVELTSLATVVAVDLSLETTRSVR